MAAVKREFTKIHVKKDDLVLVRSGKDKGKKGKVLMAFPKTGKIIVEGVAIATKHQKPRGLGQAGGIIKQEAAIFASKVMLVCPQCGEGTRLAHRFEADGSKVRACKKCGSSLDS
ncbi:MAG: 50S ribosomal protein L24 [Christensenellaceae bacterium]|nr:50S ribosomal protein L24 [Christensenellaceae bacterium]